MNTALDIILLNCAEGIFTMNKLVISDDIEKTRRSSRRV